MLKMCDDMNQKYVYCIIPTFNRLSELKNVIQQMREQTYQNIKIIVINDGCSDGTSEYLSNIKDMKIHTIHGDGNLWWGESINEGLKYVLKKATDEDCVLMLNDDTYFDESLIQNFISDMDRHNMPSIFASINADFETRKTYLLGYSINYLKTDITTITSFDDNATMHALPGRGIFLSVKTVKKVGMINTFFFKQSHGDLEYTSRASEKGIELRICQKAIIYTKAKTSNDNQMSHSFFARLTSRYTTNSFLLRLLFFSIRGPFFLRLWALPRFTVYRIKKYLSV
tara:strand:- start:1896 stop:2747 length:852 start_codon:yes stop_codon:yes gene_type:complete